MQTYREFRPTGFDPAGLALDDRQDWLVLPVLQNRDSGPLDESNFEVAVEEMGGEGEDVEVHRFGHWGCGWFEIIIVRPDTEAAKKAEEIEASLANYPVLDEEDLSNREYECYIEGWNGHDVREFRRALTALAEKFCATEEEAQEIEDVLDDADNERLRELYEANVNNAFEMTGEGARTFVEDAAKKIGFDGLMKFYRELRGEPDPNAPDPNQYTLNI